MSKWKDKLFGTVCFLLAGVIHVAAVLGMPFLAPQSAWERLLASSAQLHPEW